MFSVVAPIIMSSLLGRTETRGSAGSEFVEKQVDKLATSLRESTARLTESGAQAMKLPSMTFQQRFRNYGTAVTVGVFIGAAVTSGVLAGVISLAAWRSTALREAADEAVRLARMAVGGRRGGGGAEDAHQGGAEDGDGDDGGDARPLRDRVEALEREVAELKRRI